MNITIGQYYPIDSLIHKLDSRFKIVSTLIYITMLFVSSNFLGYLISFLFLTIIVKLSKTPLKMLLSGLKGIFFIIIFTVVLNIFFTKGDDIIFSIWIISVTKTGLLQAIKMTVRLILLVVGSSVLTLTTSPIELTDGIEYLLKPLKKIGVPSHEIAMMMTITLRFIPTLIEELDKITKAQKARGANLETGGIVNRAKALVPILVPLLLSSFRRAEELATAMEARGYRGDIDRTKMKELKLIKNDYIAGLCMIMYIILMISARIFINIK